jgi:predicted MFS family arabinose efflux permease
LLYEPGDALYNSRHEDYPGKECGGDNATTPIDTSFGIMCWRRVACFYGFHPFLPVVHFRPWSLDWRTTYQILSATLLVAVPVAAFVVPWRIFVAGPQDSVAGREARTGEQGWSVRDALRSRMYWALTQVFFFTATAMFTVLVQAVVFLIDLGFSPLTAASAYGVIGMLSVVSVSMSGLLAERFGLRQVVSASFAGTATGVLLLLALSWWRSGWLLAAFVAVFGLCMGVRGPTVSAVATRKFAGPKVATIYGMIFGANAVGAAFGSLMGGVLHDLTGGYRAGFTLSLCAVVLAVAPFWTVKELRNFR